MRGKKGRHLHLPYSKTDADKTIKTDKTRIEQKFETEIKTDKDHNKMRGNIKNFDKFIRRRLFLNDNKLGAETISPCKEFQADTTRAE